MRRLPVVITAAVLALAGPATAHAATATTADGNLNYQANAGEVNNVSFARVSGDKFKVTDLGTTIVAGTGCTQDSPNVVTCTTGRNRPLIAHLGDQNDRAASKTSRGVQFYGDEGNDRLAGASGRDTLDGGVGDDTLTGGSGSDRLIGGWGNDQLFGNSGNDTLQGNADDDLLTGGSGNDNISGGDGTDTIREESAPNGSDSLAGDGGNDTVDYSARPNAVNVSIDSVADDGDRASNERDNVRTTVDRVLGSAGSDVLTGRDNGSPDTLIGGTGDDVINPLRGEDNVDGGPGIDQITLRDLSRDNVVCGDGVDSVAADFLDVVGSDCENARTTVAMSLALAERAAYPTVKMRVVCPRSAFKFCSGKIVMRSLSKVTSHGRKQIVTVAVRRFSVAPGTDSVLGVRVRSGIRPYLKHGLSVRAWLSAFDGAGPARSDAARLHLLLR